MAGVKDRVAVVTGAASYITGHTLAVGGER